MPGDAFLNRWLSGPRAGVVVVLLWIVGWGLGFGGLAELIVDPSGEIEDIWPAEMAIPGFFGGLVFAALLWISGELRHLDRASLARFTAQGAVTGLLLGVLSTTTGGPIPFAASTAEMLGIATALGAVAGLGTAVFFLLITQGPAFITHGQTH